MSLTEIAIKRPILIIVFFIVTTLFGGISYQNLKYELLPSIAAPFVTVVTVYPGAGPKEVENGLTKIIEDGLAGVSKTKRISANSSEGMFVITIEFLADADADKATEEVQRAVGQILPELPAGAKSPSIAKFSVSDLPILRLGIMAQVDDQALYQLVKDQIRPRLAQIRSIGRVQLLGGQEREVKIYLDHGKLDQYDLSLLEVADALRKANVDVPVGKVEDRDAELGIRLTGKVSRFAQLENQVIATQPDGSTLRLQDVGRVVAGAKELAVISRLNRQASIALTVQKQTGANAVEVAANVRQELAKLEADYQAVGLKFQIAQDSSEFTLEAANAVFTDLFIAIFLVALVMLVFLHSLRNALIVMLAIPTSLVFAFILMYFMDFSLNLMTLLAMSLVIGILVDDSIVVLENIYRHLEMGKDKRTASIDGRNEIGFAALSITLVDVVVFLPMAFVPGLVGSLVREFSLVVVASTLASLLVSFTLTPMIASRFARLEHPTRATFFGRVILFIEGQISRLTHFYQTILVWGLRHRLATGFICVALLLGSFSLVGYGFIGSEFVPTGDKGELSLNLTLPPGTKLAETNQAVGRLEDKLGSMPEVKRLFTTVGFGTDINGEITAPNVAQITIITAPADQRSKTTRQMAREVKRLALEEPGAKVNVSPIGLLGADGAPILIQVLGSNRDSVFKAANLLLATLKNTPGTLNPRLATELGKPEVEVVLDRRRLTDLGLDIETVGFALCTALNGNEDLKFRDQNVEVPVRIVLEKFDRNSTDQLLGLSFVNDQGQKVYLKQFADLKLISSPTMLERRNRNVAVLVQSQVVGRAVGEVGEDIKKGMAAQRLPEGVSISYEGDLELSDDAFGKLGLALITSISLVYLIMVALYNNWGYPFVVLFSIPTAIVGALLALALTAKTLNVFSIFGMIMLVGLVTKNAILLVDRANDVRLEGRGVLYALIDAGRTRLRPILMTTIAMVIGMVPLALATGPGGEINSSLAWVLIGGLSSSMFLTLVLVPVVYYQFTRLAEGQKKHETNHRATAAPLAVARGLAVLIVATLLGLPALAQGPAARKLSLAEAQQIALAENPEILIGQLEQAKAKAQLREAQSGFFPQLAVNGNYQHNIKPQVFFLPGNLLDPTGSPEFSAVAASAKNTYNLALDLSVPIFDPEIGRATAVAKLQGEQARLDLAALRQKKTGEVRKAYYAILLAQAGGDLARAALARNSASLQETRGRFRQGYLSEADTLQLYLNAENARAAVGKADNSIALAKASLKLLLNWPAEQPDVALTDTLAIQPDDLLADFATFADLVQANPHLQKLEVGRQLAEGNLRLEQSRRLPRLNGVWQYSALSQAENFKFGNYHWINTNYVGLQLNIPVFTGFRTQARTAQAQIARQQLNHQLAYAKQSYLLEAQTHLHQMRELKRQLEVQQKTIAAGERLYASVKSRWQQGLAKLGDLQDAELSLNQARNNHLQAVHDYLVARENLRQVLGQVE